LSELFIESETMLLLISESPRQFSKQGTMLFFEAVDDAYVFVV